MAYHLPADLEQIVKQRMTSGAYPSEDEVLRDALAALEQLEQERLVRWNERNRLAVEQSERGLSRPIDEQRLLACLRESLAKEGIVE